MCEAKRDSLLGQTEATDHCVVKKRVTAGESRDSPCTWRDRYAKSCAADPGASQNDLSVGKRKDGTKGCHSDCLDGEEDETWAICRLRVFESVCVSTGVAEQRGEEQGGLKGCRHNVLNLKSLLVYTVNVQHLYIMLLYLYGTQTDFTSLPIFTH